MARALGAGELSPESMCCDPVSGLAVDARLDRASLCENDDVRVAVEGMPYWSSDELKQIARENGPAAAVAAAYLREGADFLEKTQGPFSLAVVDLRSETVLLAVDRMGVRPMCFARRGTHLVFGSTLDSVLAHPLVEPDLDPQAIFNYLFFHMVPAPGTIYRGVSKLLPGEYVLFRGENVERAFYWQADYRASGNVSFESLSRGLHELLRAAVSRAADRERIGAFLSGGTDSSTVAGILTEVRHKPAETYSIGFAAEGFDEMEYARITSQHFGTRAHEYYVTPQDVVEAIPLIAAAYDEPFGNASAVPTYYCAKMARQNGIDLMLAGDGGDEIFGGNVRYAKQRVFELYHLLPGALRHGLIEPMATGLPGTDRLAPLRKLKSYVSQATIPLPERLESYNFLHRTPLEDIFEADYLSEINTRAPEQLLREVYWRTNSDSYVNRMLNLDLKVTLADNDLRKVNRMCELAGVTVHYPLLDEEMVAFAARLPPDFKVKGVKLRYFFKKALEGFLPRATLTKSKHGFGLPFGLWLRTHAPLRELAEESLRSFRQRGYIRPAYLDHLLEQHRAEHATYYGVMIWVIMMLEQWIQAHEGSARPPCQGTSE
jgi:asparagine synthase (glutamine-hydrolysing)